MESAYDKLPRAYRLPDATRLGTVRLQVADLTRSLSFYSHVVGFQKLDQSEKRATLGVPGNATPIVELIELAGSTPVPRRGRLGLFHFAILVPDRAALGRFVAHLSELGIRAGSADHLVSEALYLPDPDGLGIEVYADRPRALWGRNGNELVMATNPLDLSDLARAAGETPWDGMPVGTVIGHVHLHVGDLDEGRAFFHTALGLDPTVWSYPGALFLSAGGYHHHLGINTWAGPGAAWPKADDARLLEWEILLPTASDADAAARSVEEAGYSVTRAEAGWMLVDPWGTAVRLTWSD
ncbi:MAG: VOC family protein [Anaerolineae bacterium]|nr:VOC family protein [Gemmatimonadaceae bacterium]